MTNSLADIEGLIERRQFAGAIDKLESILTLEPENYQAIFLLGICYYRQKHFAKAEAEFRQVIAGATSAEKAWYYLGLTLEHQARLSEAKRAFQTAIALNPNFTKARKKLDLSGPSRPSPLPLPQASQPRTRQRPDEESEDAVARRLREAELARGVFTQQKGAFVFGVERVFRFVSGALVTSLGVAMFTGMLGGQEFALPIGILFGIVAGIISAGTTSRLI